MIRFSTLLVFASLLALTPPALAQSNDQEFARVDGQLFAAGGNLRIDETVLDNAFLTGGRVLARGNYGENLYFAGGDLELDGAVAGDLFMAGGTLNILGGVGDDAYVAGGTVRQHGDSVIAGDAFLAGGMVELDGFIGGNVHAGAGTFRLNGEVTGDLDVEAEHILLGPGARIGGALTWRSPNELEIDDGAAVAGTVTQLEPRLGRDGFMGDRVGIGTIPALLALVLLAALLHLATPGILSGASDLLTERPLQSFGFGLAVAIGGPILFMLLMMTLIGIPVAVLLGLVLALLSVTGAVVASYWIGLRARSFANTSLRDPAFWGRVGWTAVGFAVLAVVRWVPWVGDLAVGILYAIAVGATVVSVWDRFRGPTPASPAI